MERILLQIQQFADAAHGEQMRKYSDERYIVHPVKVMKTCTKYTDKLEILGAALLHDVLEDTPVTEKELLDFLSTVMDTERAKAALTLVVELTDVYTKESYPQLNRKQRKEKELNRIQNTSADAQTIKYADILDNCNEIAVSDPNFAPRFLKECLAILKAADKGVELLRLQVLERVQAELRNLKRS